MLCNRPVVGNGALQLTRTFNMARIRIFVSQVRTQHPDKMKLHEKQTRRQQVKRSLSQSLTQFSLYFLLKDKGRILR